MMRLLLALMLLWPLAGQAQTFTLPECIPKTIWTPFGTGTDWVRGQADAAGVTTSYRAWWCQQPSGTWVPYMHLSVEGARWTLNQIDTELSTVFRSADRLAALKATINRYSIKPTAAEVPSWDAAAVQAKAALATIKPAPPPPASAYVTPSAGTIFTYANGKLTGVTTRKSTAGAACDCTKAKAVVGAKTYCALTSGPATEVAECVKATP